MGPQREMLEHHADMRSHPRQLAVAHDETGAVDADLCTVQVDLTGVGPFEPVDTAQQGRLAGARWAEHADGLALLDLEADVGQHDEIAEALRYAGHVEDFPALRHRVP